jgi:hypothetical protein
MPSDSEPSGSEHRDLGDMLGQVGSASGPYRFEALRARAEAREAVKQSGYKSPVRRLFERLFLRRQDRDS